MNQYELSRAFWDFAFSNPEKMNPTHISIYFFAMEQCNRLGWKDKFGLPTSVVMEATGIKSYNTYKKHFDELVAFGFFTCIQLSKNQYSSNIIALSNSDKALDKALDKAFVKHETKHLIKQDESTIQSTSESTCSIDKQINKEPITNNKEPKNKGVKKIVTPELLFRESEFFDFAKFENEFKDNPKYNIFNLQYYHEIVLNWSDGKGQKKKDWIATTKNFMLGDVKDKKAVLNNQNLLNEQGNRNNQPKYGKPDYGELERKLGSLFE